MTFKIIQGNALEKIKELKRLKKKNVYCETCKKHIGFKEETGRYDVINGVIQRGQGKGKDLLSFCSEECKDKITSENIGKEK